MTDLQQKLPGIATAFITGLAAMFLSEHYHAPAMLFALLLGIALSFLYQETRCKVGIEFTATQILRIGVALLGFRLALSDLAQLGWQTLVLLAVAIASTILFGMALAKALGLQKRLGALTGGSVAICGASAAMAITSVIPEHKNKERDTLLTVIGVTSLSTLAMILYPILVNYLQFDHHQAGLFLGGTIHDVAQVVGAGYSVSEETGNLATLVKLVRVSLLMPVVALMVIAIKRFCQTEQQVENTAKFPGFLLAFAAFMLINSFIELPEFVTSGANEISRVALLTAIAAIGMKSNLAKLVSVGIKPIILMTLETVWIALFILAYLCFF